MGNRPAHSRTGALAYAWEAGGLYKSWLMEHEGTYYLFYNAKNKQPDGRIEQTGVATSRDLVHWKRSPLNPILPNGEPGQFDDTFASDPAVFRHGHRWVMFYFGNCSDGHARDSVAFSNDLLHWEKSGEVLIDVGPVGSIDSRHAHKPGLIAWDGRLLHFYCAVSPRPAVRLVTLPSMKAAESLLRSVIGSESSDSPRRRARRRRRGLRGR